MSEREEAIALANRVLDRINADPDDDLAVLARQFLRAMEAQDLCNRWMKAAISLGKTDRNVVFDPMNPEAWAEANKRERQTQE